MLTVFFFVVVVKLQVQKAFDFMTGISASDQWDSLRNGSR